MNTIVSWVVAVAMLLFGGTVPTTHPQSQSAAVVASQSAQPTQQPVTQQPVLASAPATPAATAAPITQAANPATAVVVQPTIQHIVNYVSTPQPEGYVSTTTFYLALANLRTDLLTQIIKGSNTQVTPQQVAANGFYAQYNVAPISPAVNSLSNTTISNPTITGGSIDSSSLVGTITNAISSALGSIDALTSNTITAKNTTTETLAVTATSTLNGVTLSNSNCSSYGNGGKLTTDAFGDVICAPDQGGSGTSVAGANTQIQYNSAGSFGASPNFTFNGSYLAVSGLISNASSTFTSTLNANTLNLANALTATNGGTGTSTAPTLGQLLIGNGSGGYSLTATSSLGISSGTWGNITGTLSNQTDLQNALNGKISLSSLSATYPLAYNNLTGIFSLGFGTTTNNTWAGTQTFTNTITGSISGNANTATALQTARTINGVSFDGTANIVVASTTLLGDTNTFSGTNTFGNVIDTGATANTLLYANASKQLTAAAVSGPIVFSAGTLSLGTVGVGNGGTGITTTPTFGQLLVGNSTGGYTLTATSSLGIGGGGGTWGSITGTLASQTDLQNALNLKLSSSAISSSASLAALVSDETGSGSLVFANSPTFAGTPVFSGGVVNYSTVSTTTIPDQTPYAWTVATSSTASLPAQRFRVMVRVRQLRLEQTVMW